MLTRRRFLLISGAGLATAVLAACGGGQPAAAPSSAAAAKPSTPASPAAASASAKPAASPAASAAAIGGGSLKILLRSHFVPAYDEWFDKWAADWAAKNKVEVTVDHILAGQLPAKWAAEVAANGGHDLFGFTLGGAINLYNKQLVDVSDLADQLAKQYGGWADPLASNIGKVEGAWKGLPDYFLDHSTFYRKDLFEANGLKPVDKWEDLLTVGPALKAKGNPIGIAINQQSNDSSNSWHALLWSYGVSYAREDGKMANFNTQQTKDVVKLAADIYQKGMTDEVLSWDDTGNNDGMLSGRISWIQNGLSVLRTAQKTKPDLAKNLAVASAPAGPKGRFTPVPTSTFGLMNWSKSVSAAKALIADYFGVYRETVKASGGYDQPLLKDFRKKPMTVLGEEPGLETLQDFDQVARTSG